MFACIRCTGITTTRGWAGCHKQSGARDSLQLNDEGEFELALHIRIPVEKTFELTLSDRCDAGLQQSVP